MTDWYPDDPADDGELEAPRGADLKPMRRYLMSREPMPLMTRKTTLCGLEWQAPYWVGEPLRLFRPEGLLTPHAPPGSRLVEWSVGATIVLPVSRQPIWLSTFLLLEGVGERGQEPMRARPHLPACEPGVRMRLRIIDGQGEPLGPPLEPTIWGVTAY